MSDGVNPVEFGRMLATLDNIHQYILEVRSDVKTQNSRVYKLEEKTSQLAERLETHTHDNASGMSMKDKMVTHGVPAAAGGGVAFAIIWGLLEVIKLLAGKI